MSLPAEWAEVELATISEKIMVGIASSATHAYRTKGIPLLRNQNIKPGRLADDDLLFVDETYELAFRGKRLQPGDLLTARTGYPGTTCIVPPQFDGAQSFTTLITRPDQKRVDALFLCHYANSSQGQDFFDRSQIGGAQKNVNVATLRKMPIPLPPLPEQRAIAEALGDVDALIDSLDRLIAKKRDLKQGAMQQLLTGKTRLPGFMKKSGSRETAIGDLPSDWRLASIGEHCRITTGGRNTQDRISDGRYPFFVRSQTIERINSYSYDGEAVLTAGDGVGTGKVFHYINGRFDVHQRVYRMSGFSESLDGYFFFLYFSNHFYDRIMSMTAKSSVDSIRMNMIAEMQIPLPAPEEQRAIAKALREMDTEINLLEQRRDKTRLLKQGMMQELLTGKTRLV